jgi:GNAT superfamily N-acetyltransferase
MSVCLIRSATNADAVEAVAVMRRSIVESCVADHRNDGPTLERWLRNKTPEAFRVWRNWPDNFMAVAVVQGMICGLGAVRQSGDLDVCYVHPSWQRRGIGRSLLLALESQAHDWGLQMLRLISSRAARGFYESHGWTFVPEESGPGYGVLFDYRYRKKLTQSPNNAMQRTRDKIGPDGTSKVASR